jgi:hypothetical protein
MLKSRLIIAIVVLASCTESSRAQTSYPMLSRVTPTAVQRGTTREITIAGTGNFAGAWRLLCEAPGLEGEVIVIDDAKKDPVKPLDAAAKGMRPAQNSVKVKLTVAPDAPLGPREIRVATAQGASSVGLVVVVDSPVVTEVDDKVNDQPASAESIHLPVVLSGAIAKTEDVDWYAFEATAGQRVAFRVWGNRLENKIHDLQMHFDPILVLHDAQGRELAADDNHEFADPLLTYEFKEAGRYLLEIRDTTYAGNASWTYVLEATAGPCVTSVFPLAVHAGEMARLKAQGFNFDVDRAIDLDVPADLPRGPWLTSLPTAQGPTLAVPLVVTSLPMTSEDEDSPSPPDQGQVLSLPAALSGRLATEGDVDTYRFEAKKGQVHAFEVIARRAGAATDAVLRIVNAKGMVLAEADDTFGKDPRLEWTAPADATYAIQVLDLHSRGGAQFGYVLEAEPAQPDFVLTCDPDKLNVGPGGRVPVFVQVSRRGNFNGPVTLEWVDLPPGIASSPLTIPATMTQGVLVVSAASEGAPTAALVNLRGKAEGPDGLIVRNATPRQEIYLPGGGRGLFAVNTLALALTDPSDIAVETSPEAIKLKPGGTATIDVKITRRKDFDKPVNLAVILQHLGGVHGNPLPPGVKPADSGNKTLLGSGETAGKIVLQAASTAAPCENVPITVMGHVSINFVVKTSYCSKPILLTIEPK